MKIVQRTPETSGGKASHLSAAIFACSLLAFGCPSLAHGCIALSGDPSSPAVISGERAVIIWDNAHKIEHFIRQADISATGPTLGFLVPTPQTPELVETNPSIFELVRQEAAPLKVPDVVYQTPLEMIRDFVGAFNTPRGIFTTISAQLAVALPSTNSIQVVHEQDVANYHAVVLAADDAGALAKWLKDNGYAWSKDAEMWLKPYIEAKWKITAFKLNKLSTEQSSTSLSTHAIRMSFPSEHPFFPYSEPHEVEREPNVKGRSLDVAILSNERMGGSLANGNAWPGEVQFSGPIQSSYNQEHLLAFAKLGGQMTLPLRLTYFRDTSNPRPGTADLNFSPSADQSLMIKTEVDPYLPKEYRLDLSHPLSDMAALLIILLVTSPFIYLFWISRKPSEKPTVPRPY